MPQSNVQVLGEALRSLRHSQSLSQRQLGERLGSNVDGNYLRMLETGMRRPGRENLLRLLAALGLQDMLAVNHMLALARYEPVSESESASYRTQAGVFSSAPLSGSLRGFQLVRELEGTPAGPAEAARYHHLVLESLTLIFETQLRKPVKEERLDEGRKRADIVFNNVADHGFFRALRESHGVHCPYVFFECKNYAMDLGNPAFDQLVGRFGDKSGLFGALVCRRNTDPARTLKRCRDLVAKNRGYVVVLDDTDLQRMLDHRAKSDETAIDDHMDNLFRTLVL